MTAVTEELGPATRGLAGRRRKTPERLKGGTYNMWKDRKRQGSLGKLKEIVKDHEPHFLGLNEAQLFWAILRQVPGYRWYGSRTVRGAEQNGFLVREDVQAGDGRIFDLGGDGWTTVDGHHHVGLVAYSLLIAGWYKATQLHLPPSINWPDGQPVGPKERVDDYIRAMQRIRTHELRRKHSKRGRGYAGDWNNMPGRDDGYASVTWLAKEANLEIGFDPENGPGHKGIDGVLVDKDTVDLKRVETYDTYGSDHPLVIYVVKKREVPARQKLLLGR